MSFYTRGLEPKIQRRIRTTDYIAIKLFSEALPYLHCFSFQCLTVLVTQFNVTLMYSKYNFDHIQTYSSKYLFLYKRDDNRDKRDLLTSQTPTHEF